ncbi:hypothetical protein [Marinobacter psychrophilus]|uniref:hypothetical protein n=1 Tax=Marinobacter psychrophilus TaxID=330734 RepID=UPI001B68B00C|nr:hypothetical protein [Marinobacter psychrophilus]MBQ0763690.1 hypothetical protein [Marinobacter psychrophilus]MBQ0844408.1 hypothetical protein [Marinobacter psychrophilus]
MPSNVRLSVDQVRETELSIHDMRSADDDIPCRGRNGSSRYASVVYRQVVPRADGENHFVDHASVEHALVHRVMAIPGLGCRRLQAVQTRESL